MLPRRSLVVKYGFCTAIAATTFFLWVSSPNCYTDYGVSRWRKLVQDLQMIGVNETQLRLQFQQLATQVNATYTTDNKTLDEIFRYVQVMKRQIPANPHNFRYIINPSTICKGSDIFLLVYVHSSPEHHKRRTAIRQTWGNPKNFQDSIIKVVFLMGIPKEKPRQEALQLESDTYGDILQESFLDSYRNLTYKAIEGLKWVTHNCKHARFILKTDDDIFVNMFNLVRHLKSLVEFGGGEVNRLLLCLVWYRMKVIRDAKSKWFISKAEFSDDYFATYCSGSAYVMTPDVVADMYNASLQTPFFWVDDFYITGLLAGKINVKHEKFNSVYVLGPGVFLDKFTEKNKWRTLVFGHVHNLNHVHQVWKNILEDRKIKGVPPTGHNNSLVINVGVR